jgi:hypothetical protein
MMFCDQILRKQKLNAGTQQHNGKEKKSKEMESSKFN